MKVFLVFCLEAVPLLCEVAPLLLVVELLVDVLADLVDSLQMLSCVLLSVLQRVRNVGLMEVLLKFSLDVHWRVCVFPRSLVTFG